MKVDIDSIGPEGLQVDEPLTPAWLSEVLGPLPDYAPAAPGHLCVRLDRVDDAVHVRGHVELPLRSTCGRCLGPAPLRVRAALELTVVPRQQEPVAAEDGEVTEEDIGIATYDDHAVDLGRAVHDEVLLELPIQPLCRSDCAGLCSTCGENRNERACACAPCGDMRWEALRRIKLG